MVSRSWAGSTFFNQAISRWREICYKAKFVREKVLIITMNSLYPYMFVTCVNAYNGKDREKSVHNKYFYDISICCVFVVSVLYYIFFYGEKI